MKKVNPTAERRGFLTVSPPVEHEGEVLLFPLDRIIQAYAPSLAEGPTSNERAVVSSLFNTTTLGPHCHPAAEERAVGDPYDATQDSHQFERKVGADAAEYEAPGQEADREGQEPQADLSGIGAEMFGSEE